MSWHSDTMRDVGVHLLSETLGDDNSIVLAEGLERLEPIPYRATIGAVRTEDSAYGEGAFDSHDIEEQCTVVVYFDGHRLAALLSMTAVIPIFGDGIWSIRSIENETELQVTLQLYRKQLRSKRRSGKVTS